MRPLGSYDDFEVRECLRLLFTLNKSWHLCSDYRIEPSFGFLPFLDRQIFDRGCNDGRDFTAQRSYIALATWMNAVR